MARRLTLDATPLSVVRLEAFDGLPDWLEGRWFSLTRTPEELSIVCESHCVPAGLIARPGWVRFEVDGPLEFSEIGVLAGILDPLRAAEISVFVVSTFDTDYILVSEERVGETIEALERAGHRVVRPNRAPQEFTTEENEE